MNRSSPYLQRLKHPLLRQRHAGIIGKPKKKPASVQKGQIPKSVLLDLERLDESVDALDRIYQEILTVIERQARDAISLNHNLTELFAGKEGQVAQVLDWSAERAMTPFDAYRQLAERLMAELRPILDPSGSLTSIPYQDLIEWSEMPAHGSPNEKLIANISYARQRSLRTFFQEVKARFQPEAVPDNASQLAAADIMAAFCVEQPDLIVLPLKKNSGAVTLSLRLLKSPLAMHISKANLNVILRANAAIATLARLNGRHKQAAKLNEGSSAMLLKLTGRQYQFSNFDRHTFGEEMIVVMQPDHLQYHMPETLFDLLASAVRAHVADVIFMQR